MSDEKMSETPETDALTTAPVDPAVNYASAKLTNALNLCASLERRLRAATQERDRLQAELAARSEQAEKDREDGARLNWLEQVNVSGATKRKEPAMPSAPSAPAELPEKVREAIEKIAAQMNGRLLPSFIRRLAIDIALLAIEELEKEQRT